METNSDRLQKLQKEADELSKKSAIASSQKDELNRELKELLNTLKGMGITSIKQLDSEIQDIEKNLSQKIEEVENNLQEAGL